MQILTGKPRITRHILSNRSTVNRRTHNNNTIHRTIKQRLRTICTINNNLILARLTDKTPTPRSKRRTSKRSTVKLLTITHKLTVLHISLKIHSVRKRTQRIPLQEITSPDPHQSQTEPRPFRPDQILPERQTTLLQPRRLMRQRQKKSKKNSRFWNRKSIVS